MTTHSKPFFTIVAFAFLCCGRTAFGADLDITITEETGGTSSVSVAPGASVDYVITGLLTDTNNEGLAGFAFDLTFTGGGLVSQVARGPNMSTFDITNPLPDPLDGFGGTLIGGDLIQVGGAQNTMDGVGPVVTGIGKTTEEILATGTVTAPTQPGCYTLAVSNVSATAIQQDEPGPVYATELAGVGTLTGLTISVSTTCDVVVRVEQIAPAGGDGLSWPTAYRTLQDALADATATEIWVAQGTYKPDRDDANPTGTGDRTATFNLVDGVPVYGGFPTDGGDGTFGARDPYDPAYETILSGDIGVQLEPTDNSYHVVLVGSGVSTVLDGFTISDGYADGGGADRYGGGMTCAGSAVVVNCRFADNTAAPCVFR